MFASPPVVICPEGQLSQDPRAATEYFLSLPQFVHVFEDENLPAAHGDWALFPEHVYPTEQDLHDERVWASPPSVKDDAPQVWHAVACPPVAYLLSAPQSVHALAPDPLYFPTAHAVVADVPPQWLPAGQREQAVRVVVLTPLPDVRLPAGHVLQDSAVPALCLLSAPQFVQVDAPAPAYVPATQAVSALPPGHLCPLAHFEQVSRVFTEPPPVWLPAAQVLHVVLFVASAYLVSPPQSVHLLGDGGMSNLPADSENFERKGMEEGSRRLC